MHGIEAGDNIVWAVEAIAEYREIVAPYVRAARAAHRRLIYFRFGRHPSLLPDATAAEVVEVNPVAGFESFVRSVHIAIEPHV